MKTEHRHLIALVYELDGSLVLNSNVQKRQLCMFDFLCICALSLHISLSNVCPVALPELTKAENNVCL